MRGVRLDYRIGDEITPQDRAEQLRGVRLPAGVDPLRAPFCSEPPEPVGEL
jgi:hypothetical protein